MFCAQSKQGGLLLVELLSRSPAAASAPSPNAVGPRSTEGATAIEYSVIGGMVAVAIVVATTSVGLRLNDLYQTVADKIIPPT